MPDADMSEEKLTKLEARAAELAGETPPADSYDGFSPQFKQAMERGQEKVRQHQEMIDNERLAVTEALALHDYKAAALAALNLSITVSNPHRALVYAQQSTTLAILAANFTHRIETVNE